jgi:hypothetical protein
MPVAVISLHTEASRAFEAKGIIAAFHVAVFPRDALTRVDIKAIVVRVSVAVDGDAFDGQVGGLEEVCRPRRRLDQFDIAQSRRCRNGTTREPASAESPSLRPENSWRPRPLLPLPLITPLPSIVTFLTSTAASMAKPTVAPKPSLERVDIFIFREVVGPEQFGILVDEKRDIVLEPKGAHEKLCHR